MGSNLFSVTTAMRKGVATFCHPKKRRWEYDDVVFSMNVLGTDETTGRLLCSFDLGLGGGYGDLASRAESDDVRHRCM